MSAGVYSVEAVTAAWSMWDRLRDMCRDRSEFIAQKTGRFCQPSAFGALTVLQGQCSVEVMEEACRVFSTPTEIEWRAAFVGKILLRTRAGSFCMNRRVAAALGFDSTPCHCISFE